MSMRSLQTIVGKAVISHQFRKGILNGRRAELIGEFDLEPEEVASVMAIRANTFAEFAAEVEQFMQPCNRRVDLPAGGFAVGL